MHNHLERKERALFEGDAMDVAGYKEKASVLAPFLTEQERNALNVSVDQLERQEFTLVIVGEFNVGKSSFLNALLGRPVLITDVLECTATVTFLHNANHAPEARPDFVRVVYRTGAVRWEPMTELRTLTTAKDPKVAEEIERVHVFVADEIIPKGVTVVDSPGLNGLKAHHEAITKRQMAVSHAAIFLFACDRGIGTDADRKALEELFKYAATVMVVVNKWDLAATTGRKKEYFLEPIHEAVNAARTASGRKTPNGDEVLDQVYFMSSKRVFDALKAPEETRALDHEEFNDFWALKSAIARAVDSDARTKALKRQPLLLMRQLTNVTLAKLREELTEMEGVKRDATIEAERERVKAQLSKLDDSCKSLLELQEVDAQFEVDKCRLILGRVAPDLKEKDLKSFLGNRPEYGDPKMLCSEDFQKMIGNWVRGEMQGKIGERVGKLFQAMARDLFERLSAQGEDLVKFNSDIPLEVPLPPIASPSAAVNNDLMKFDTKRDRLRKVLDGLEEAKRAHEATIRETHGAEQRERDLEKDRQRLVTQRDGLGKRPGPSVWYEERRRLELVYRGGWGIADWFFGPKEVWHTDHIRHEDWSDARAWDQRFQDADAAVANAAKSLDEAKMKAQRARQAKEALPKVKDEIDGKRKELQRLEKERQQEKARLRTLALEEARAALLKTWTSEIESAVKRIDEGLQEQAHNLLEQIGERMRKHQEDKVGAYLKALDAEERRISGLDEERAERKRKCVSGIQELERLAGDINKELSDLGVR